MTDPFAAYHRAGRRMTLARVIPTVTAALALAVTVTVVTGTTHTDPGSAPPPSAAGAPFDAATSGAPSTASGAASGAAGSWAAVLPQPPAGPDAPTGVAPSGAASTGSTLPATGTSRWTINVDTTGYQAEIDDCLWVRMDLGTHAPVVGAHNYCGGDVVLGMTPGDSVVLSGGELDGVYVVTAARDAHAGDNARAATEGLGGSVILQTCYWGAGGAERLVALTRG